jgi:hypothetical protein
LPLVRDDEDSSPEDQPEQQEPIQQFAEKSLQKGASFKQMLLGIGDWLSRRKLPDSVKKGIADEWQSVWTGQKPSKTRGKKQKFMAKPFQSFGPRDDKKKRKL